jgi:hypothetical protein
VLRVDFGGTGSGLRSGKLLLGYLERRVVENVWLFYLRLWGVPQAAVEGQRDELARAAIHAIGHSVAECLAVPAMGTIKPTQLLLWFSLGTGHVVPTCKVDLVDQYSFSAGQWWASPSSI